MKNSPLVTILLVILAVISLWSVGLCWTFISKSRELHLLQAQVNQIQYRQAGINQLVGETIEYGKKNQAIDPILEFIGAKPKSGTVATNKPAAK